MDNQFAEQYINLEDTILDDLDFDNLKEVFPRLEKQKELADKSGVWKYRVRSRRMIIKMGYEFDDLERSMGELIWLAGQWEMNKEDSDLEDAMILLERFIEFLPAFPNVAPNDIHQAIEILKEWFATTSRELHYLVWALFKTYSKLGDLTVAEEYKQQLLKLEAVTPFGFKSDHPSCETCLTCKKIHYYASIGLLQKAMEIAEPLLEDDVDPCLTSPRTGLSYLLDAYLDAGKLAEIEILLPTFTQHLDMPTKAPVRIVLPLLRYYIITKNQQEIDKIIDNYNPIIKDLADRWSAQKFLSLVNLEKEINI